MTTSRRAAGRMPEHRLSRVFDPRVVAVVGASDRPGSLGSALWQALTLPAHAAEVPGLADGAPRLRFCGRALAVNPRLRTIGEHPCHPTVSDLPEVPDLALIATPMTAVEGVVRDCGRAGCRFAIVFSRADGEREVVERILRAARQAGVRLVGPGARGPLRTASGFDASAHGSAIDALAALESGSTSVLSQSGAWLSVLRDFARGTSIRFASMLATGEAADLDVGELLDYFAFDASTREVLVYIEHIRDAHAFMSSVRQLARMKPVVVMKSDHRDLYRIPDGTHATALARHDRIVDAAIRRAGAVRAATVTHMVGCARLLSGRGRRRYRRVAVVTNGRGPGVVAQDAMAARGLECASLAEDTTLDLRRALPGYAAVANPVDLAGDATAERYERALQLVSADAGVDAVLVLHAPQPMLAAEELARTIVRVAETTDKAIVVVFGGGGSVVGARSILDQAQVAQFLTVDHAIEAMATMDSYATHQAILREVPARRSDAFRPDVERARQCMESVWNDGRVRFHAHEAQEFLSCFGLAMVSSPMVRRPSEAVAAADAIGYPVVLKVVSPDIGSKSDVGGVELDLHSAADVRAAWRRLHANVLRWAPAARLAGVTVQPFVRRRSQRELYAGLASDPVFGSVLLFGAGGAAVERVDDVAFELPPVNRVLIRHWLERTRVHRLLARYADLPAVSMEAVEILLERLSALACECPEVVACDLNPVLADTDGVRIADARIVLHPRASALHRRVGRSYDHLAIHPYPADLESILALRDGRRVEVRPIRPDDADLERAFVAALAPETRYFRFMMNVRELTPAMIERFTQIDYRYELALVAVETVPSGQRFCAVARITPSGPEAECEFAIVVGEWMQRSGLGRLLMQALIKAAQARSYRTMIGSVLAENLPMIAFCQSLGFAIAADPEDPSLMIASLALSEAT